MTTQKLEPVIATVGDPQPIIDPAKMPDRYAVQAQHAAKACFGDLDSAADIYVVSVSFSFRS